MTTLRAISRRLPASFPRAAGLLALLLATLIPSFTETAIANGDTRTINLYHAHTHESISATYLVGGQYDSGVLRQLNWFLRDWRRDEPTNMDPRLFDVVWEAYRSAGAGHQVINVVSAYRSPETNAMLRARSRAVAKYSQHMLGKAMDTTMPGMPMSHIREVGMRMQRGGVGYYPTAGTPFVHLDVGNVRSWPRMSYDQLARLFPDGKTVHLPTNGQPLARYEEARAEIEAGGNGAYVTAPRRTFGGFFAMLFGGGGGGEDDESEIAAPAPSTRKQWAALAPRHGRGAKASAADVEEGGGETAPAPRGRAQQIARAEADLPRGETALSEPAVEATIEPAKETTRSTVRAPLPPRGRPASLDAKPTPLEAPERPVAVAANEADGSNALRGAVSSQDSVADDSAPARDATNAPLPPHRPVTLVAAANAPLPPARPATLLAANARTDTSAKAAIATLIDTSGAERRSGDGEDPLAYAPDGKVAAKPRATPDAPGSTAAHPGATRAAGRKADVVPARLDRSNFRTLTGATPTSRASAGSVMGSSIAAVRSAARAAAPSLLAAPRAAHAAGFAAASDTPPADRFAPGAQK